MVSGFYILCIYMRNIETRAPKTKGELSDLIGRMVFGVFSSKPVAFEYLRKIVDVDARIRALEVIIPETEAESDARVLYELELAQCRCSKLPNIGNIKAALRALAEARVRGLLPLDVSLNLLKELSFGSPNQIDLISSVAASELLKAHARQAACAEGISQGRLNDMILMLNSVR